MCQPASFVLTATDVFWSGTNDSHEEIIKEHQLDDTTSPPSILRVEILPPDMDMSKPLREWGWKIDQDIMPTWHNPIQDEHRCRMELEKWFARNVLASGEHETSGTARFICGSATIEEVSGSATIKHVYDSATIKAVSGSATIKEVSGSATIKAVYDSATIKAVSGSATINVVSGSATINVVYGSATIKEVSGSATIIRYGGTVTLRPGSLAVCVDRSVAGKVSAVLAATEE